MCSTSAPDTPPNYLREALTKIEAAWEDDLLHKTSINSWIGTLAIEADTAYCLRSSGCQADLEPLGNGECIKIETHYGDGVIFDYVFSTRLERGGASFRPIHDQTLHHEATLLAKALAILAKLKVPPRRIYELKTDSILIDSGVRATAKVQAALAETTFAGLSQILPQGRLDNRCALTPSTSEANPYRIFGTSDDSDRLHCKRKLPVTEAARPVCARVWRDVDAEEAVTRGESVLITGPPGTGKSYLSCKLITLLRDKGERVIVLAKTHLAAHNVGGITINHYANKALRRGKFAAGTWLVVDEYSMVDVACWAQLAKAAFCGAKWIIIGDPNQYLPIQDRWCGQALAKSFEHSSLLHTMVGGNRCRLTHNHRSDPPLFDFCGSLCPGGPATTSRSGKWSPQLGRSSP
jgi:hypothetical protein